MSEREKHFKAELTTLINKYSLENYSDMPDFLMADMILGFIKTSGETMKRIKTSGETMKRNLDWHG